MATTSREFFSIWGASVSGGLDDLADFDGLTSGEFGWSARGLPCRSVSGGDFSPQEIKAMEQLYGASIRTV